MAISELEDLARRHFDLVQILEKRGVIDDNLQLVVRLSTKNIVGVPTGLPVSPNHEDVVVDIPPLYPLVPPTASVEHLRFLGYAHVLQGTRLCIYLDVRREWHMTSGFGGFLRRLGDWLNDGASGKFDPENALFHPVGGVLHRSPDTPTLVVRRPLAEKRNWTFTRASLRLRTPHRMDLLAWRGGLRPLNGDFVALAILAGAPFQLGAGQRLSSFLASFARAGFPAPDAVLSQLAVTAAVGTPGSAVHFLIAVPHVPWAGATPRHQLLAGRLPPEFGDELRAYVREHGSMQGIDLNAIANPTIQWCAVSDERPEVTTRRDVGTPMAAFGGKVVEIWGCGGLGSWIAEYVVRAGASRVVLRDDSSVTGGHLVRQNYSEQDVGYSKAEALARRLREIADTADIECVAGHVLKNLDDGLPQCDVLVDATIDASVSEVVDKMASQARGGRPVVSSVATDIGTATLGILHVLAPSDALNVNQLDVAAGERVDASVELERFSVLWDASSAHDTLTPTQGCSVPTFRGSAADLAGTAAALTSCLARHLTVPVSGTHLTALPHANGDGPCHVFLSGDAAVA